jgi:hypothetical protein
MSIRFGCEIGSLPFRCIPIHFRRLKNVEWKLIEDHFEKKFSSWIGKLLLYGNRIILINSIITSLPMFMLSFLNSKESKKRVRILFLKKRLDFFLIMIHLTK